MACRGDPERFRDCPTSKAKRKLSELMAIGFNSSKAFEGGNWRKN
jgi:hypothetical protein